MCKSGIRLSLVGSEMCIRDSYKSCAIDTCVERWAKRLHACAHLLSTSASRILPIDHYSELSIVKETYQVRPHLSEGLPRR